MVAGDGQVVEGEGLHLFEPLLAGEEEGLLQVLRRLPVAAEADPGRPPAGEEAGPQGGLPQGHPLGEDVLGFSVGSLQAQEGALGEEGLGEEGGVLLGKALQDGEAPVQLPPHPVPQGEEEAEAGGGVRHPLGVAEEGLHFAPFQEGPSRPLQGPEEEPAPVAPGGLQGLFPGPEGEGGLEEPPGRLLGR